MRTFTAATGWSSAAMVRTARKRVEVAIMFKTVGKEPNWYFLRMFRPGESSFLFIYFTKVSLSTIAASAQ
jgi:hypothetical protein